MIWIIKRADNGRSVKYCASLEMAKAEIDGWGKLGIVCKVVEVKL